MEVLQIIDELDEMVEQSMNVFGYSVANKENLLSLIEEIRLKLPDELKQARWVKEEREKILADARKEAEGILKEAQDKVIALIDEHEITKAAKEKSAQIMKNAQQQEADMQRNAIAYADSILEKLDKSISIALEEVHSSRRQLK